MQYTDTKRKNEQEKSRCGPPEEHSVRSIAGVILHDILQTTRVSSKTYPSKQRIERKRFAKTLCRYLWNKGTESKNNANAPARTPARTPTQRLTSDYESSTVVLRVLGASGNHSDAGFAKMSTNDHKNFQIAPEKRFTTSSTHATSREKCNFAKLLDLHCPVKFPDWRTADIEQLVKLNSSPKNVSSFVWAILRGVLPKQFFGSKTTTKRRLREFISRIVSLRRIERCTLHEAMIGVKTSDYAFLDNVDYRGEEKEENTCCV